MLSDRILSAGGIGILAAIAISGIAVIILVFRQTRPSVSVSESDTDTLRRILRNSSLPIMSQFFVRAVDLLVALAVLRLLGPAGNGQYALAVIIWFYVKTVSDFGLGLYTTREISRDNQIAGRLTGSTAIFRILVLMIAIVPVGAYLGIRWSTDSISNTVIVAVVILLLNVVPGSLGEAVNSALNGVERMDIAAGINIGVNVFRAPLAILLAATSMGIVGIASAALAGTLVSLVSFLVAYRRLGLSPITYQLDRQQAITYARESAPLLVNALLVSLFFRFDIFIVEAFRGSEAVGLYDAAFKPINLLTIIPAYATLAVFPLMSQRANDPVDLARANRLTSYLLVTLAWIIVVATFALAGPAIRLLAGEAFLPDSVVLLRILVFFAPLSFLNGVFQYVLIAQGKQRDIVPAFGAAVLFNIVGNLLLVPWFGSVAAAILTVLTEIVIFGALVFISRGSPVAIHDPATLGRLLRPTIAGIGAIAVAALLLDWPYLAFLIGMATFGILALLLGVVGEDERRLGRKLLGRFETAAAE